MTLAPMLAAAVAAALTLAMGLRGGKASAGGTDGGGPLSTLRKDMDLAGLDALQSRRFMTIALLAPVALGGLAAWWAWSPEASGLAVAAMAMLGASVGWWLPRTWLAGRRERRRLEIVSDFPVMLDLLQISMQGGMGLPAAWANVTESLQGVSDGLAREMRRVDLESGFGMSWTSSLAAACDRTGVTEFRSLGSLLGHTQRFGAELARMLEVLSDSLRHEELQALEERAHRSSVSMLLPLTVLVLPPTLLLVLGPLLMLLLEALGQATSD